MKGDINMNPYFKIIGLAAAAKHDLISFWPAAYIFIYDPNTVIIQATVHGFDPYTKKHFFKLIKDRFECHYTFTEKEVTSVTRKEL